MTVVGATTGQYSEYLSQQLCIDNRILLSTKHTDFADLNLGYEVRVEWVDAPLRRAGTSCSSRRPQPRRPEVEKKIASQFLFRNDSLEYT
jgi:hypothetical protein